MYIHVFENQMLGVTNVYIDIDHQRIASFSVNSQHIVISFHKKNSHQLP